MKVRNYRCAAEFQKASRSANVFIAAANQFARVKSAIEDTRTAAGNSRQKVDEAAIFIKFFNEDPNFRKHIGRFCSKIRLNWEEKPVVIAGDDTCLYLPQEIWSAFKYTDEARKISANLVDEADSELVEFEIAGEKICFRGPGIHTTYFISTMGVRGYRDALYRSAEIAGVSQSYPILRRTTLTARSLFEKDQIKRFVGTSVVQLINNDHIQRYAFPHPVHSDNAFLGLYRYPDRPISEFEERYTAEQDSYALAYVQLLDSMFSKTNPLTSRSRTIPVIGREPWLIVQQMGDGAKQAPLNLKAFKGAQFIGPPLIDKSTPMSLLNLDPYVAGADAFVLPPPNTDRPEDLRWWAYVMFSLIVAVKTHPRDAEKIVIVMADATAIKFVQLYFDLANNGWTDDYPIMKIDHNQKYEGMRHIQTGLCHFLIAEDLTRSFPLQTAEIAASDILEQHQSTSNKSTSPYSEYFTEPTALHFADSLSPADVSFMCTSHSERQEIHDDCATVGDFLAANGYSATWPGNDRNNMKSLYGALKNCFPLIGVITEHLADAATWNGKIPECTHPIIASHIYERTLLLILLGKFQIVFPVGVGGILEICCRLLVDDHFTKFRSNPVIFYSPKYAQLGQKQSGFLTSIITALLGEEQFQKMRKDRPLDACGDLRPYFLVSELQEAFAIIGRVRVESPSVG